MHPSLLCAAYLLFTWICCFVCVLQCSSPSSFLLSQCLITTTIHSSVHLHSSLSFWSFCTIHSLLWTLSLCVLLSSLLISALWLPLLYSPTLLPFSGASAQFSSLFLYPHMTSILYSLLSTLSHFYLLYDFPLIDIYSGTIFIPQILAPLSLICKCLPNDNNTKLWIGDL